jgi:hypothetical protein
VPRRSVIVISSGWLWIGGAQRSAIVSIVDVSEMTELRRDQRGSLAPQP